MNAESLELLEYERLRAAYIEAVRTGARERNRHARDEPSGAKPKPAGQPFDQPDGPFDYTRYFSRSRPEPEPDTLE